MSVSGMSESLVSEMPKRAGLKSVSLVVGWRGDSGRLGARVIDYLRKKLECRMWEKLSLEHYFPFDGVNVENNVVQFPESILHASTKHRLLLFLSDPPQYEWYSFLNAIIDGAERVAKVQALYTLGGMVSLIPHTQPRELFMIFNSEKTKRSVTACPQGRNMDYQSPVDQKPTLSSFLLWVAQRRNIPGVSLWVPIPFYLATVGDISAEKVAVSFFNRQLQWGVDLSDLEGDADRQHDAIARVRSDREEIDDYISRLECRRDLTEEENLKLLKTIEEVLSEEE